METKTIRRSFPYLSLMPEIEAAIALSNEPKARSRINKFSLVYIPNDATRALFPRARLRARGRESEQGRGRGRAGGARILYRKGCALPAGQ